MEKTKVHAIILACLLVTSFVVQAQSSGEAQIADPPSLSDTTPNARSVLQRFNETEPYLKERPDRKSLRTTLNGYCFMLRPECLDYVRGNRSDVLEALPDNPQYWTHFWLYLKTSPVGFDPEDLTLTDPRFSYGELMNAMAHWVVYYVAKEGAHDVDRTNVFAAHIRRLANDSVVLIDKMIFTAGLGYARSALNLAMSEAAAAGNVEDLNRLTSHVRSFSRDERSFRRVFEGELAYGQAMRATQPSTPEALFAHQRQQHKEVLKLGVLSGTSYLPEPELMTELELELMREEVKHDLALITEVGKVITQISERTPADYWGKGTDFVAQGLIDAETDARGEELTLMALSAWEDYLRSYRLVDLWYLVLQALSDVYAGRVVAGIPARPAPAHWTWEWLDNEQDLCLVAISHALSLNGSDTIRVCSHYWR